MYFLLKTYKQTNKTEKAKCLYPNAEMGHSSETQAVGLTVTEPSEEDFFHGVMWIAYLSYTCQSWTKSFPH